MTIPSKPIVLRVIADAADVRLFNKLFDDRFTRSLREPGLLARIGTPLTKQPVAKGTALYSHEASFSVPGLAWLKERAASVHEARRLDLTPEETFGLLLAHWRSLYPVGMPGVRDKDYGRAVERFAAYKAAAAKADGRDVEAARLLSAGADIRRELDAERRENERLNGSIGRVLAQMSK